MDSEPNQEALAIYAIKELEEYEHELVEEKAIDVGAPQVVSILWEIESLDPAVEEYVKLIRDHSIVQKVVESDKKTLEIFNVKYCQLVRSIQQILQAKFEDIPVPFITRPINELRTRIAALLEATELAYQFIAGYHTEMSTDPLRDLAPLSHSSIYIRACVRLFTLVGLRVEELEMLDGVATMFIDD